MSTATSRRTMTLNLSDPEMDILQSLSDSKGVSKTALLKQAIKLYKSLEERVEQGKKVFVEDPQTKEKVELVDL